MAYEDAESNDPDLPDALYAARRVLNTRKEPGETGAIEMYRSIRDQDAARFASLLGSLEKDWQEFKVNRLKAQKGAQADETDEGEAAALAKIEMLLKEFK